MFDSPRSSFSQNEWIPNVLCKVKCTWNLHSSTSPMNLTFDSLGSAASNTRHTKKHTKTHPNVSIVRLNGPRTHGSPCIYWKKRNRLLNQCGRGEENERMFLLDNSCMLQEDPETVLVYSYSGQRRLSEFGSQTVIESLPVPLLLLQRKPHGTDLSLTSITKTVCHHNSSIVVPTCVQIIGQS